MVQAPKLDTELKEQIHKKDKTHSLVKRKILYKVLEQLLEVMGPLMLWSDLLTPNNIVTVEQDILLIQRVLRRRWQRLQRHRAVNSHTVMIQPTFVERHPFWVWQEGKTVPVQVVQISTVPSETQDKPNSWQTQLIVSQPVKLGHKASQVQVPPAGRVAQCLHNWKNIILDP